MAKKLSISIFFPAYNDEESIPKLVKDATETISPLTDDYEIIIVDDASPDNVGQVADELAKKDKHIRVVHHKKNRGYGGALRSGFKAAKKDLIFYTDGDCQYDVREITRLLPYIDDPEIDMVNGYKMKRGDNFARKLLGRGYHWTIKILFNLKIRDVDCDFRLFKRHVIDSIDLTYNSGCICVEMMKRIHMKGYKIKEVPVHHYPRISGTSQFFRINRIFNLFRGVFELWWNLVIKETFRKH